MNNNEKLLRVFSDLFDVPFNKLGLELAQDDIDRWDSLGMINLIVSLEQLFDVKFDIVEMSEMNTISFIKELLVAKGVQFE
jgi:acyl carrier protein